MVQKMRKNSREAEVLRIYENPMKTLKGNTREYGKGEYF